MRLSGWWALAAGLLAFHWVGCQPASPTGGGEAAPGQNARPPGQAASATPARKRLPRFEDPSSGVRLDAPAEGWRFLDRQAAAEVDPEAVAGLVDGARCVGLVRMGPMPTERLAPLLDARLQTLGLAEQTISWKEPVLYAGVTAMRAQLKGRRGDDAVSVRLTLAVLPAQGAERRLYEIRAESTHEAHTEARRCLDRVTAAFDVIPIQTPKPVAEPEPVAEPAPAAEPEPAAP